MQCVCKITAIRAQRPPPQRSHPVTPFGRVWPPGHSPCIHPYYILHKQCLRTTHSVFQSGTWRCKLMSFFKRPLSICNGLALAASPMQRATSCSCIGISLSPHNLQKWCCMRERTKPKTWHSKRKHLRPSEAPLAEWHWLSSPRRGRLVGSFEGFPPCSLQNP